MSRAATPQVSFADLEFMQQGIFLDSVLQTISYFLDQHGEMIEKVRSDLERGLKNPATGRNGMTPSQVLRSLVLMRVKSWDLRELSERIADGYTLRHFTAWVDDRQRCEWLCSGQVRSERVGLQSRDSQHPLRFSPHVRNLQRAHACAVGSPFVQYRLLRRDRPLR